MNDTQEPQTFPSRASAIKVVGSTIFLLALTAIVLGLLIAMKSDAHSGQLCVAYLLFCFFYALHLASGIRVHPVAYILPSLFVYVEFTTPLATLFFYFFRTVLPGSPSTDPSLSNALLSTFIGSGLMEELMKSVPALIGLLLASRPKTAVNSSARLLNLLRCSTPMRGMLIGVAAGAGFVFVDIFYQVTPHSGIYVMSQRHFAGGIEEFTALSQRVVSGITSHVVWTGISGFFIGLSARHPRYLAILLATAWLLPAAFHTVWNVSAFLGEWRWVKLTLPLPTFVACFLIAKTSERRESSRLRA